MEIIKIGKYTLGIKPQQDFEKWIRAKNDISKFLGLNEQEQRNIFLRWKHGFTNQDSNEAAEDDCCAFSAMINTFDKDNWEKLDEGCRRYYQQKIKWIDSCNEVWRGILARSNTLKRNPSGYN